MLLEKNGILGRKIMATGGGRCNITNTACVHCDLTLDFFKSLGMELYHDAEGRYYPYSNQAREVARVLEEAALEKGTGSGAGLRCDEDPEKGGSFSDLQRETILFCKEGDPGSQEARLLRHWGLLETDMVWHAVWV